MKREFRVLENVFWEDSFVGNVKGRRTLDFLLGRRRHVLDDSNTIQAFARKGGGERRRRRRKRVVVAPFSFVVEKEEEAFSDETKTKTTLFNTNCYVKKRQRGGG